MQVRGKFHIIFTLTPKATAPNSHSTEGYVHQSQSGHYTEENCSACTRTQTKSYWLSISETVYEETQMQWPWKS